MQRSALLLLVLAFAVVHQATAQSPVRVCVSSSSRAAEAAACTEWLKRSIPANSTVGVSFECVYEASEDRCMQRISAGNAELVRGGGNLIFNSGKTYGLVAYASEDYGDAAGAAYYGVAVVKKAFCDARGNDVTLSDLKGAKVCVTGYRRTAGWTLPMGYLVSRGIMPVIADNANVQDDAETFANFFGEVCAPGTTDGPGNAAGPANDGSTTGREFNKLCTVCSKAGQTCNAQSAYIDYGGALRCMVEGAGEVALVKHTTPFDFSTIGNDRTTWSVPQEDLRLICADNSGCRPISQWSTCGYARAPAHAFMGKVSSTQNEEAVRLLAAASAEPSWVAEGIRLGVLSADAASLRTIRPSGKPTTVPDLMGSETYDAFNALHNLRTPPEVAAAQQSGSKSGLSKGAIAGIVIGAVAGTALLAVAIGMFVVRRNKRLAWEEFSRQHDSSAVKMNGKGVVGV